MAKRIATQLAEEIASYIWPLDVQITAGPNAQTLSRWHRWAKLLDARMRLDGSEKNKRKPK